MLAEQFHAAAAAARNTAAVDEIARLTWRAHAEGQILDAEAEAISEAVQARRAVLAGENAQPNRRPFWAFLEAPASTSREDVRPRPPPRPRPQRQGADHALGAVPEPQDREGQGIWRRHRQGAGRARGALVGLPQRQERALLPSLREDRRGRRLRPLDRRGGAQGPRGRGNPLMGPAGSSGYASVASTFWATMAGVGGCCERRTPTISATFRPPPPILPSPKSRLEQRIKIFLSPMRSSGRASEPSGTPLAVSIRLSWLRLSSKDSFKKSSPRTSIFIQ